MQIIVRDNNVDQALRALKKKLQREGVYREMKLRRHYEKPSEKRARERATELLVPLSPHPVIVMLGRKVTEAMGRAAMIDGDMVPFSTTGCCPGLTLVSLPHPSGRNAAQWTPKARVRAREIMRGGGAGGAAAARNRISASMTPRTSGPR